MNLSTPTTADIADNIVAQIEANIEQTVPLFPKAFVRVLAKALAGVFILLYKYAGFMLLQQFVQHATMRETVVSGKTIRPLVEWGRMVGVGDPAPAVQAELEIDVTVTNQTGSLPAGALLLHAATGVMYAVVAPVSLNAATVQARIRAISDSRGGDGSGSIGNLEAGATVTFASPLPNVATDALVTRQLVTGADAESVENYRARVIRRFQRRPQGGAYADYQQWGEEVAGILNVYPYTGDPGEVNVYVEATTESSGDPDGIPTQAQLDAVEESIERDEDGRATRRPATAVVNVLPITRTAFDILVTGLSASDVNAAKQALEAAVDEYLRSREPFILGLSTLPRNDRVTQAAVSGVADEAVSAAGGSMTSLKVFLNSVETDSYTLAEGEKAKLGTATYV